MQDCIRKIFIYFHCYGLRRLFVHPLPIPISCILRGCCFLALFIFDETIDSTKWWIHCFIRTTSSTRQAIGLDYFIFICKFHYEAGGRAPTVIFFLSQTRNDRKWTTYPLSTTSNKSHRIIVRKKNLRTHFIWAVGLLGMPMLVCVCVCVALFRMLSIGNSTPRMDKHSLRHSKWLLAYTIRWETHAATSAGTDVRVASVAFQIYCAHSGRRHRRAKRRIIEF